MPTVLSVTMAVGARTLARKQAIVSRLAAIEELAGIDVLCADKTGTVTQNRLTLGPPYCVQGIGPEQVIFAAALASRREDEDPIDVAVLSGLSDGDQDTYQVTRFQPFDPVHKRTEATVRGPYGQLFRVTKGGSSRSLPTLRRFRRKRNRRSTSLPHGDSARWAWRVRTNEGASACSA
jgi:H+-transporting ATPase